jgi:hypothetical protein
MRSSEAAVPGLFSTRVSDFVDPDEETGEIGAILLSQVDRLKGGLHAMPTFQRLGPQSGEVAFLKTLRGLGHVRRRAGDT